MGGAGPNRLTHSRGGFSAVSASDVPLLRREIVFFLLESRADDTPLLVARSKSVGAWRRLADSMYSIWPVVVSKYELPVMPCACGNVPQQMDALFALVTDGITPFTRL